MSPPEPPSSFELVDVTHRFLIEASETLATPGEPTAILERLAELVAPRVADFCAVHVRGDEGAELLRVLHLDAAQVDRLTEAGARYPIRSSPKSSVQRVFDTGEPILLAEIDATTLRERAQDEEHLRILQSLGARSAMIVPAHGRERVVATLTFVSSDPTRRYGPGDLAALSDLARLAALAMENARLAKSERRARRDAEAAVERASRLQKLTAALATAVTPEDATNAMAHECRAAVGACMGFVWLLRPDGEALSLVSQAGSDADVLESFAELPLDSDLPVMQAFREGEPIFLHSPEDRAARFPNSLLDRDLGTRAWAAVPIWADRRRLGGMVVSFDTPRRFPREERELLVAMAQQCAATVERVRLFEAEDRARAQALRAAHQTRRLESIAATLSKRLTHLEVAQIVVDEGRDAVAGVCAGLWLRSENGTLEPLVTAGDRTAWDAAFAAPPFEPPLHLHEVVGRAEPRWLEGTDDRGPVALLPLVADDGVVGGLAYCCASGQRLDDEARTFLRLLADHAAQALDRALLSEQDRASRRELAETNRTLQAVIEASPAAIVVLDEEGTVQLWNPGAERIFGWSADEAIGAPYPAVPSEELAQLRENIAAVVDGRTLAGFETTRVRRDGSRVPVALWAAPIRRPDGRTHCLAVVVDIEERKRAEESAREGERRKDLFLAMLGHELRNPLAPILTALELTKLDPSQTAQALEVVERQARHLVRLVDDLLDLSRITRGKLELFREDVDLADVLGQAAEMVGPMIERAGQELWIDIDGPLPVHGDPTRLAQVFGNLLSNAAKYAPSGGVVTVHGRTERDQAVITVIDEGPGIPAELLPELFEPFVQGERSLDRRQGGLGIGLSLVHSLVTAHGGDVAVESSSERGARFTIRLPTGRPSRRSAPPRRAEPAADDKPLRIMVVDDNEDAAELMATLLRRRGHEVAVTYDGPSALELFERFRPDAALLDIGLPVMDGYELARRLRDDDPELLLVAVSGYGQSSDRARSRDAGFHHHLVKPVRMADLAPVLEEARPDA